MRKPMARRFFLLLLQLAIACNRGADAADSARAATLAAQRDSLLESRLRVTSDSGDVLIARWVMPSWLSEISGLAPLPDGRLLAHDDERALVTVIDPKRGMVLKRFALGKGGLLGDFEGITTVSDTIYMVTSTGQLHVFMEGDNGTGVPYRVVDTRLSEECEFEGVVYEPTSRTLLLPCKLMLRNEVKGRLRVFRVPLSGADGAVTTQLELPLGETASKKGRFEASDITRDPASGHLIVLASGQRAVLEFTPDGEVIREAELPKVGQHKQPEGIAMTRDGLLIVSDEAVAGPAAIAVYRWPLTSIPRTAP